jgi:transcriptional regulator GlxA family with amidase domain
LIYAELEVYNQHTTTTTTTTPNEAITMLTKSFFGYAAVGAGLLTSAMAQVAPVAPVPTPVAPVAPVAPVPTKETCGQEIPVEENPVDPNEPAESIPVNWGVLAMPGVDMIDVFGPLEILYFVAAKEFLNVTVITPTADPVVVKPPGNNTAGSIFQPTIVGSATMQDNLDLEVLLIPGGAAARDPNMMFIDDWVAQMYPNVRYLITICTGAIFPARAGVLDGRRATTNKRAWDVVTKHGNGVEWVAPARYVVDGNIWSSSGVTSGMDLMLHWVATWYGEEFAENISQLTEHEIRAESDDPFTDLAGVPHQGQL